MFTFWLLNSIQVCLWMCLTIYQSHSFTNQTAKSTPQVTLNTIFDSSYRAEQYQTDILFFTDSFSRAVQQK